MKGDSAVVLVLSMGNNDVTPNVAQGLHTVGVFLLILY